MTMPPMLEAPALPGPPGLLPLAQGVMPAPDPAAAALAEQQAREQRQLKQRALRAIFGDDFPVAKDGEATEQDWVRWVTGRWDAHATGAAEPLHYAARNRLFRDGIQWISAKGNRGTWKEPAMPKDAVRAVDNHVGPALDWHLQVMSEQRPGWRFTASNTDPDRTRKAQAQQIAVEYQFHRQRMRSVMREAVRHAQTDGCAFLLTYWEPDAGPWEELAAGQGKRPIGDVGTRVYTLEQVRVSANATATQRPMYWVIKETLPLAKAVALYGPEVAKHSDDAIGTHSPYSVRALETRMTQSPLHQGQATVDCFMLLADKGEYLPHGLTVVVVGNKLTFGPTGLIAGRVPIVRLTDGSTDPAFYPAPRMNEWIAPQMRVNMIKSKWIESVRINAGGRFISKANAVVGETMVGGMTSVIEVRGAAPIDESLRPAPSFALGQDAKELLAQEVKALEDRTGWNDNARGQFSADQSGRAILAIREQLERTFAPLVYAASEAMAEWAECQVSWMRWGYQMPRMLGVVGSNRPDLAREFSSIDFDGNVDVFADAETMMPMPRALKLFLLDQDLERGVIDIREYRRRRPMAYAADQMTPDDVHEAKAKRVAEALRLRQPAEPIAWQDDEAIHQDVLERDIILAADIEPDIREAASQRWIALAMQAAQKAGGPPPGSGADPNADPNAPGAPLEGPPAGPPSGVPMPPEQAPTLGSNPSIAAAPNAPLQMQGPASPTPALV